MAAKSPVAKMNENIMRMINEYADSIQENMDDIVKDMGKRGAQALRANSKKALKQDTGDYAKGWKYQVDKQRLKTSVTIYNDHPGLPHLLEHGHVTRNGTSRTLPDTPAHEHIAPVEKELIETFEREVVSRL